MAEGRMLKRNISDSRRLAELKTDSARMLWTWIIPFLDSAGRFYASADMIKGKIVPRITTFTVRNIPSYLQDMHRVGLIVIYDVDGEKLLQYRKFDAFQNIKKDREAPPLPAPKNPDQVPNNSGLDQDQVPIKSRLPVPNLNEVNLREDIYRVDHDLPLKKIKFIPPSLAAVTSYCQERKNQVNPQKWIDHYVSNGWRVGKTKMVNWQAAVRTWENSDVGNGSKVDQKTTPGKAGVDPFCICPECHKEILKTDRSGVGCLHCERSQAGEASLKRIMATVVAEDDCPPFPGARP